MIVQFHKLCTLFLFFVCCAIQLHAIPGANDSLTNDTSALVYTFTIEEGIFEPALRLFDKAMDEAEALDADLILLQLDTYGGAVDVADKIRTRLLNTDIPTAVYIINNAASAGALISVACDSIYMTREATIGAAVVVEQSGGAAGEKYQSYFREKFRATAEAKGRNPDIAEAMVNPDVAIDGVIDSGKILTFTANEALANDYCDKIVSTKEEALAHIGYTEYTLVTHETSSLEEIIRFFTQPAVSGVLLTVIFFGIFFELQSPGIGFPLVAAITAAVFYFTPLYLEGLAENWEILMFLVGLILIAVELFVIPGFGFAGISGIVLILGGLILSLVQNVQFDFTYTDTGDFGRSVLIVTGSMLTTIVLLVLLGRNFATSPLTRMLVFTDATRKEEGYTTDSFQDQTDLPGQVGTAITPLHPSGTVDINGERYDAFTQGEYIEAGKPIRVLEAKGFSVKVKEIST